MEDCYRREFEGTVKEVNKDKDGKACFIVLDQTAFYPNSGGQPHDTGTLICNGKEYRVLYVGKFRGEVSHEVDKEGLRPGDHVKGCIDWDRRYTFMRYHTASHVFSRVIFDELGAEVSGSQIYLDKCRNDFTIENFNKEKILELAEKANEIIQEGREVRIKILPREEAFKIPDLIRTKINLLPETVQRIRVVEIEGLDQQACGGCHVANTREIGGIEITKMENKGKNNRRVYFVLKNNNMNPE
jgi:misacylated tRNA(Ala) deacylase